MATRNIVPRANGEGSVGTAAKKWGNVQTVGMNLNGFDVAKLLLLRKNSTVYVYNNIVVAKTLPAGLLLNCTAAGTSDTTEPDCSNVSIGDTVNDGTVVWTVSSFLGGVGHSIGEIYPYAGTTQPPGALLCDGAAVGRTVYPDLFDEIGTTYGSGDGSTTFNLPTLTNAATVDGYTKTAYDTAGSYTFTAPKSGTYKIMVKGAGGGGMGGYHTTAVSLGGSGGGEGGTSFAWEHLNAGDTVSIVVGAGGTGGAAGGIQGTDGGDTTATVNLTTYTGGGGKSDQTGGSGDYSGAYGGMVIRGVANGGQGGAAGGGGGYGRGGNGGGGGNSGTPSDFPGENGTDGGCVIEFVGSSERWYIQAFNASTDPALVDLTQILQDLATRLQREQVPAFNHRDVLTTSGTYTAPVTGWYRIVVKGGGGGGASGMHTASLSLGGFGGNEGGITFGWEHLDAGDQVSVVVGAGGAGGTVVANVNTPGGGGGDTTVTVNGNSYVGGGGQGGQVNSQTVGGTGDVPGAPGGAPQYETSTSYQSYGGHGGGNGGGNYFRPAGINGGGGSGGYGSMSTPTNGGDGGGGFAWFEYFDGSLN